MLDISVLLRSVHHALKVPLSSIQNLTELMLLGIEGPMEPGIRQDVQDIAEETERLSMLMEEFLAYLRLSHQPLHLESVDLSALLHARDLSVPETLPLVHTDSVVLGEVVKRVVARLKHLSGDEPIQVTPLEEAHTLSLLFATREVSTYQLTPAFRPEPERRYLGELDLLFCHQALARLGGDFGWRHDSDHRVLYSIILPITS